VIAHAVLRPSDTCMILTQCSLSLVFFFGLQGDAGLCINLRFFSVFWCSFKASVVSFDTAYLIPFPSCPG